MRPGFLIMQKTNFSIFESHYDIKYVITMRPGFLTMQTFFFIFEPHYDITYAITMRPGFLTVQNTNFSIFESNLSDMCS